MSWLQRATSNATVVAAVSAIGQLGGVAGTIVTPRILEKQSLLTAALGFLSWQLLTVSIVAFTVSTSGDHLGASELAVVCVFTAVSRIGLWGVDLTLRQIVQMRTPDNMRMKVFGVQHGITEAVSLALYACVSREIMAFPALCVASVAAVGFAWACVTLAYCHDYWGTYRTQCTADPPIRHIYRNLSD